MNPTPARLPCGHRPRGGSRVCKTCEEIATRRARIARGECATCGDALPAAQRGRDCPGCRRLRNAKIAVRRAARFEAGLCERCPAKRVRGSRYCAPHLALLRQRETPAPKRVYRCARCGAARHYAKTCTAPVGAA